MLTSNLYLLPGDLSVFKEEFKMIDKPENEKKTEHETFRSSDSYSWFIPL